MHTPCIMAFFERHLNPIKNDWFPGSFQVEFYTLLTINSSVILNDSSRSPKGAKYLSVKWTKLIHRVSNQLNALIGPKYLLGLLKTYCWWSGKRLDSPSSIAGSPNFLEIGPHVNIENYVRAGYDIWYGNYYGIFL